MMGKESRRGAGINKALAQLTTRRRRRRDKNFGTKQLHDEDREATFTSAAPRRRGLLVRAPGVRALRGRRAAGAGAGAGAGAATDTGAGAGAWSGEGVRFRRREDRAPRARAAPNKARDAFPRPGGTRDVGEGSPCQSRPLDGSDAGDGRTAGGSSAQRSRDAAAAAAGRW